MTEQQKIIRIPFSRKIFDEYNWKSTKALFSFLEKINPKTFEDHGLLEKNIFIEKLYAQINEIEGYGKTLADIRETLGKDFIDYYFQSDYWHLMNCYKKERMKLRKLFRIVNTILR